MIIHCVTIPRNTDRQAKLPERWQGFDIQFHQGIDHEDHKIPGFEHTIALIGCWIGHIRIWQELAYKPGWHIIIEDDAFPRPHFHQAINEVENHDFNFDIVKLHHQCTRPVLGIRALLKEEWVSSGCYMIRHTEKYLSRVIPMAPDRMLSTISPIAAFFPPAAGMSAPESTIPARTYVR